MNQPDTRPPSRPSPPPVGPTTAEDYRQPEPMAPANFTSNTDGPHLIFGRPIENPTFKQPAPVTAEVSEELKELVTYIRCTPGQPSGFLWSYEKSLEEMQRFIAKETARLAGELAEAKEQFQIQQKNYLNLCAAILGEGTFVAETDPFKAVARMKSDLAAARADAAGLREQLKVQHELVQPYGCANDNREQLKADLAAANARAEQAEKELAEVIEDAARQACHTSRAERDYNGQVAGTLVTDSGGISTNADLLRRLATMNRFRIVAEYHRMVVGYWPENDPEHTAARSGRLPAPADGKE